MGISLSVKGDKMEFDLIDYEIRAYEFTFSSPNSKYAKGSEDERYLSITGDISKTIENHKDILETIRDWAKIEYEDDSYYNWVKVTETYRESMIREITFPHAFIKHHHEEIDPYTGEGHFNLLLMQKVDKINDIIIDPNNEVFPSLNDLMNEYNEDTKNSTKDDEVSKDSIIETVYMLPTNTSPMTAEIWVDGYNKGTKYPGIKKGDYVFMDINSYIVKIMEQLGYSEAEVNTTDKQIDYIIVKNSLSQYGFLEMISEIKIRDIVDKITHISGYRITNFLEDSTTNKYIVEITRDLAEINLDGTKIADGYMYNGNVYPEDLGTFIRGLDYDIPRVFTSSFEVSMPGYPSHRITLNDMVISCLDVINDLKSESGIQFLSQIINIKNVYELNLEHTPLITPSVFTPQYPELFQVSDGTTIYFGGNQAWLSTTYQQSRGCGITAVANVMAYYALTKNSALYPYPAHTPFDIKEFTTFQQDICDHYVPAGIFGVISNDMMINGGLKYATDHKVTLGYDELVGIGTVNAANFIRNALTDHNPVLVTIIANSKFNNMNLVGPGTGLGTYSATGSFERHVLTIVCLDETKRRYPKITVSSWGCPAILDLGDLMSGLINGMLCFKL